MRGRWRTYALGLIPARAGKTTTRRRRSRGRTAHPRACGENIASALKNVPATGSSPRVRGKPVSRRSMTWERGLIPARAGKTSRPRRSRTCGTAHPRACGENQGRHDRLSEARGSSPRVRGKRFGHLVEVLDAGLIPARAGKTSVRTAMAAFFRAHPRACGENTSTPTGWINPRGSSPRVRGKLLVVGAAVVIAGLIPARAGKTFAGRGRRRALRAHPRACGENAVRLSFSPKTSGSSPRVRGKRPPRPRRVDAHGLIPARAGKTMTTQTTSTRRPAHPRACGENGTSTNPCGRTWGSSPRVRGKRLAEEEVARVEGLIPARAGKT